MSINTPTLIDCLQSFNRKERYWVIRTILGVGEELDIKIDAHLAFLKELFPGNSLPKGKFWWGFDYPIDWLAASIILFTHLQNRQQNSTLPDSSTSENILEEFEDNGKFLCQTWRELCISLSKGQADNNQSKGGGKHDEANNKQSGNGDKRCEGDTEVKLIAGNQEDFDFIVVHEGIDGQMTICLIEAKGVTGWRRKQVASKFARLLLLKKYCEDKKIALTFKTFYMSPRKSKAFDIIETGPMALKKEEIGDVKKNKKKSEEEDYDFKHLCLHFPGMKAKTATNYLFPQEKKLFLMRKSKADTSLKSPSWIISCDENAETEPCTSEKNNDAGGEQDKKATK